MSTGKIIIGVVAGVAVGAILGVLFAPDKGTETRKKISKKSSDTVEDLKNQFDSLLNKLSDKLETGKEGISDFFEKGQNHADEIKKEVKNNFN